MTISTPMLPGLSPVGGKKVVAQFDGGLLSSDAGVLALREIEQRLCVAERLAACIVDPRTPEQIVHSLADIIRFRLLMISAGHEDGNDANSLRADPVFKMAHDLAPSQRDLCSQSTISRLENLPDARALLRMGRALVDLYCETFSRVPKRITLDIDDTFDAVHGAQQLRLFNAHYDEYGFQPIVVFDGEGRFITAVLRPAKRPSGKEIRGFVRRLVRTIRTNWPRVEILLRGDSHYCCPEVLDFCRVNKIDYILGVAPTSTLRSHILDLEARVKARYEATPKQGKTRGFREFYDGAKSWSRVERVIARVEAGAEGTDTRFIVTNLNKSNARRLYEDVYCRRGQAERRPDPQLLVHGPAPGYAFDLAGKLKSEVFIQSPRGSQPAERGQPDPAVGGLVGEIHRLLHQRASRTGPAQAVRHDEPAQVQAVVLFTGCIVIQYQ